jgi:hypothetical protein
MSVYRETATSADSDYLAQDLDAVCAITTNPGPIGATR